MDETLKIMRYGDAKFGDEWWPEDARAWMDEKEAVELSGLLASGSLGPRTAELLDRYGTVKFGPKWRPGEEQGRRRGEVSGARGKVFPGFSASPAFC